MRIDGVDVEEVMLHQPHGTPEGRQVLAEDAVARHALEYAGHVAAAAHQLHEQALVAHVVAEGVVDLVAMIAQCADGVGAHTLDLRVLRHQQEQLQQRGGAAAEHAFLAQADVAAADLEARIERYDVDRLVMTQDGLVEVLQQHVVEARQGGDVAVVALHELLDRQMLGRVAEAEQLGDGALVVEQQPVLGASGQHVQREAHLPQEGLALAENAQFGIIHEAQRDQIVVALDPEVALGDPADHLDIAQAAGRRLDVGFEVIFGVGELVVASDLLLPLGLEEGFGRPQTVGGQTFAHGLAQPLRAGDDTGFQQVGDHGDIGACLTLAVTQRAYGLADLETDIPQEGDEVGQRLTIGRVVVLLQQQQQVDVGMRVQLAAAVAAHGEQGDAVIRPGLALPGDGQQAIDGAGTTMDEVADVGARLEASLETLLYLCQSPLEQRDGCLRRGQLAVEGDGIVERFTLDEVIVVQEHLDQPSRKERSSSVRRVSTSTPVAVTSRVCSHWAERLLSLVTAVQSSLRTFTL